MLTHYSLSPFIVTVLSALENAKSQRSPQQIKDHDQDLRRVRQRQQLQAEQDAKLNAKQLEERKAQRLAEAKKEAKKKSIATNKTKSGTSSLNINNFTTPSYRYVCPGCGFFCCVWFSILFFLTF